MEFRRQERQWLTHLLIIVGLCFSISQTGEEMLTQVVGKSITFSNPTKQGGSLLYNGDNIAVVVEGRMDSSYKDSFKDRIQWDQETGQFTIKDLTTSDSGMYVVDGKGGAKTTYQLTVFDPVSRPMLTTADNETCSVECSVKNDRDVTLSWYSGEEIINKTSSPELSIKLSLPLVDILNRTSYICEAANPVTKVHVTFHVPTTCTETKVTDNDIERVRGSLIGAVMCVLVASGVLGLAIYLKKGRNRDVQDSSEREQAVHMYAEVTHSKPKHNQELGPCNEDLEVKSVYDHIQLHRMDILSGNV
ncbi:SLAM family member 5-like isoform X2 [Esox lucius]|uniref:Ig-like domain-containing protein n=1 Tax=Esox lucius TaxID=8010 RepID=A0A6Q2Y4T2_ESOLU|nr:SLAM family member 5-like isoform X2 [Esox lucius]